MLCDEKFGQLFVLSMCVAVFIMVVFGLSWAMLFLAIVWEGYNMLDNFSRYRQIKDEGQNMSQVARQHCDNPDDIFEYRLGREGFFLAGKKFDNAKKYCLWAIAWMLSIVGTIAIFVYMHFF